MNALILYLVIAAPALPRGGDVVTGTLDLGGPWVRVTLPGNGGSKDYWLVFTSEEAENAATDIGTGEEVTVWSQTTLRKLPDFVRCSALKWKN